MKKSILFLLLVAVISVGAQKYVPFPTDNAQWNVHYKVSEELIIESNILNYTLQGDSIINGKLYKKLYLKTGTSALPVMKLKGAIREENKQIYLIDFADWGYMSQARPLATGMKNCMKQVTQYNGYGTEYLLYDFNKNQVGDTLYNYQYGFGKIIAIDSVLVQNSYRKRYKINHYKDEYVIEGIGSVNQGLFGALTPIPACMTNFEWMFVSFSQNNECIYKSPDYKDCVTTARWDDPDYLKTGTQWYYGEKDYIFPPSNNFTDDFYSVKITGDTVVNGKNCKVMQHMRSKPMCFGYEQTVLLLQSNDTVYFYNTSSKKFSTLYVYNALAGDSWEIEYPTYKVTATIDSIRYKQSLGKILKYVSYLMQYPDNQGTFTYISSIIVGIGDIMYYFNSNIYWLPTCDESVVYTGLRCYVHPDFGTYHVSGTLDCAYVTEIPKNTYNLLKASMDSSGILTVEGDLNTQSCTLELLDLKGSVMQQTTINASQNTVNLTLYDKGLYLYRISANGVLLKAGKIVKQ